MRATFLDNIDEISTARWNQLSGTDYPFVRHEFLAALEHSGCVSTQSGWIPQHLLISDNDELIALLPLYIKQHSYGEYVFDWAWADAYHRYGKSYYPKLLAAIPFTPATGTRLCIKQDNAIATVHMFALAALKERCLQLSASSLHILFSDQQEQQSWQTAGTLSRCDVQYHWQNQAYQSFDDFLLQFSSRKRKNLRKERQRVLDQNITLAVLTGDQISEHHWQSFFDFYQMTYLKRSGHAGYLNRAFFDAIADTLSEQLVMVLAKREDRYIAGSLFFRSSDTLYGRYWGCLEEYDMLHFEACYYQGIEYCIEHGLQHFDPGAQGEHKIQRGFAPIRTYSSHWIADGQFAAAIEDYLRRETPFIDQQIVQAASLLPFKKT